MCVSRWTAVRDLWTRRDAVVMAMACACECVLVDEPRVASLRMHRIRYLVVRLAQSQIYVQQFLGSGNVARHFMRNFLRIITQLSVVIQADVNIRHDCGYVFHSVGATRKFVFGGQLGYFARITGPIAIGTRAM